MQVRSSFIHGAVKIQSTGYLIRLNVQKSRESLRIGVVIHNNVNLKSRFLRTSITQRYNKNLRKVFMLWNLRIAYRSWRCKSLELDSPPLTQPPRPGSLALQQSYQCLERADHHRCYYSCRCRWVADLEHSWSLCRIYRSCSFAVINNKLSQSI
jgi:hypothetical protein